MEIVQRFLSATVEFFAINDPETAWLATETNVLGDTEVLNQRQFLINDGDACFLGIANAAKSPFGAIENYGAAVFGKGIDTGQNFDEGGFAGAIFTDQRMNLT